VRRALSPRVLAQILLGGLGMAMLLWALLVDRGWFETHLAEHYCANDWGAQLQSWASWRVAGAGCGVFLVALVVPIGRWVGRRSWGCLMPVARIAVAVVLALVVSDLWLRRRPPPPPGPVILPDVRPDARYGWLNDGPRTTHILTDGRDIVYAMNARGERVADEHDLPDLDRPTLLVAGESISSAMGVQWEDSFAALIGKATGLQVVDAGVFGWGHDQVYARMKDELTELRHPVAVVSVTVAQQIDRDVSPTRTHLELAGDGSLFPVTAQPAWWLDSPLRALAKQLMPYHSDRALAIARALVAATASEARAHGAYPLFVLTNWGRACLPDESGAPSVQRRLFGGLDVPFVRVDLDPSWEDRTTFHPDARGHRLLADAILRALVDAKVIHLPP
jgi:hypothetical protein